MKKCVVCGRQTPKKHICTECLHKEVIRRVLSQ